MPPAPLRIRAMVRFLATACRQTLLSLTVFIFLVPPFGIRAYRDVQAGHQGSWARPSVIDRPAGTASWLQGGSARAFAWPIGPSTLEAVEGKGAWFMVFASDWVDPDATRARALVDSAASQDLSHIYVRIADSRRHFYGGPALQDLVPLAHARGMQVFGWIEPELTDPLADASDAIAAARYRSGVAALDGLALTIEGATQDPYVEQYLAGIRRGVNGKPGLGDRYLLIASTFPLPSGHPGYAYATMSRYCQVFAPMAYWRATGLAGFTGPTGVRAFLAQVFREFQDPGVNPYQRPLTITAQAYDAAEESGIPGHPPVDEIMASLEETRTRGGVSWSFYRLADTANGVTGDESAAIRTYPFWKRIVQPAIARKALIPAPDQPAVY